MLLLKITGWAYLHHVFQQNNPKYLRVGYLDAVVSSYGTLMAAHRGEVVCGVTTAKALDASMKKEVEAAIKGFLKGNEKALINYNVDPAIVGGMVINFNSYYYFLQTYFIIRLSLLGTNLLT